ncbi:MAG TPA: M35 family metallo-endopeptidase [Ignavibacteria bacterium]|nr:M35 family metallo-endopeptidase [Ignavibacteria bacterium]HMR41424.1 M35 family metallo-endopeptidase [Ignavibacteria bacterium]
MKIRLRKKTALEKDLKKNQKAEKKELRQDKRAEKKDSRKEKKEIRKDTRDAKKEVRKSGVTGKDKRAEKKAIRKDKRSDIKDVNKEKKKKVSGIKEKIKDVKHGLNIIFPVKTANLALLREDLRDIKYSDGGGIKEMVYEDVPVILNEALSRARSLAEKGRKHIEKVIKKDRSEWVKAWNSDSLLKTWFGEAELANHAKDVFDRLSSVEKRLNKKISIRVHPQRDSGTNAQNNGTFFEPKTFKVFPKLFMNSLDPATSIPDYDYIGSVMIHELIHIWFTDQKLNDGTKVYGDVLAKKLAKENPRKARRSAENYEQFCITF